MLTKTQQIYLATDVAAPEEAGERDNALVQLRPV